MKAKFFALVLTIGVMAAVTIAIQGCAKNDDTAAASEGITIPTIDTEGQ